MWKVQFIFGEFKLDHISICLTILQYLQTFTFILRPSWHFFFFFKKNKSFNGLKSKWFFFYWINDIWFIFLKENWIIFTINKTQNKTIHTCLNIQIDFFFLAKFWPLKKKMHFIKLPFILFLCYQKHFAHKLTIDTVCVNSWTRPKLQKKKPYEQTTNSSK